MTVDFHCHSTASDGTCSPAEIAAAASAGRYAALALTDHDNCDGADELLAAGARDGRVRFHAGIELSIEPGEGFDKFHLLGLGIDPRNAALKAFLARILEGRNARNARIKENFARLGLDMAGIDGYAHGDVLARPHFARWLMDRGVVKSVKEGFDRYLLPDSPRETRCYEDRWHPPQEDAIAAIHGAGGLAIMAHPKYWRRDWRATGVDFDAAGRELARLMEIGLDGVEALYQANTPGENVGFVRLATRLGCLKSAGSDFHGANKPAIPLGMQVDEAYIAPLLERLAK